MLNGISVLVADDNKLNQKVVHHILQKQNFAVTVVSNGREVIDILSEQHFDVILMDLSMPEMDGYTAAAHIRKNMHNGIPIIAFTASIYPNEVERCMEAGMNACLTKPLDQNALCHLILDLTSKKS